MNQTIYNTSNKTWLKGLTWLMCLVVCAGCSDKDIFIPHPIVGSSEVFFHEAASEDNSETFDAAEDYVHFTKSNTSVHIPANSLVYADGNVVTGSVQIESKEVRSVGKMIMNRWYTNKANDLNAVESYIDINISQDGQNVYIAEQNPLIVRVRDTSPLDDYQLFSNEAWVGYANVENPWIQSDAGNLEAKPWSFYWNGKDWNFEGYEFTIAKAGKYMIAGKVAPQNNEDQQYQLCADLPSELYDGSNTAAFATFDTFGIVADMRYDSEKMLFCTPIYQNMNGKTFSIVTISNRNTETFYFGTAHAVLKAKNKNIAIVPESKSREQILDALSEI